jgi:CheY-like chemotaxis protein
MSDPDYDAQLRLEFRDQMLDRLANMNGVLAALREGRKADGVIAEFLRDTQTLKALTAGYGYPVINMVAQRLETYLATLSEWLPRALDDIQRHSDLIGDLVERPEQPDPAAAAALLQALPTGFSFDIGDVIVKKIEIMLVTPSKLVGKLVGGELAACGFRPILLQDPLEALAQAVRIVPGMILASVVMEPINGVELVRALKILRVTRNCPMAVLTSLDADHKPLNDLTPDLAVIHTGADFGADFAAVTARFNLG